MRAFVIGFLIVVFTIIILGIGAVAVIGAKAVSDPEGFGHSVGTFVGSMHCGIGKGLGYYDSCPVDPTTR